MPEKHDTRPEKKLSLPGDFEQTLKDLLATGPTPKDGEPEKSDSESD